MKIPLWGYYINMSSPSLPLVLQWLEMLIGVNQALGILLRLWENESSNAPIFPLCHHKGKGYLPFLCFAHTEFGPPMRKWATTVRARYWFLLETSWLANDRSLAVSSHLLIAFNPCVTVFGTLQSLWPTVVLRQLYPIQKLSEAFSFNRQAVSDPPQRKDLNKKNLYLFLYWVKLGRCEPSGTQGLKLQTQKWHVLRKAHCGTARSGFNSAPRLDFGKETSDTVLGVH